MFIETIPILEDNYAYIIYDSFGEAVVVDPGESRQILEFLENRGLNLQGVLCTHKHTDHIGGLGDLCRKYQDLKIYTHYNNKENIPSANVFVKDAEEIEILSNPVRILHTSCHTMEDICFYFPKEQSLFTGDTMFVASTGRFFEGTPSDMYKSLNKILELENDTKIYVGHDYTLSNLRFAEFLEPQNVHIKEKIELVKQAERSKLPTVPSSIGEERQTNPFLRLDSQELLERLNELSGLQSTETLEVLKTIRELRNNFD